MKKYNVIAVLWEDHIQYFNTGIPKNPDELIKPTLSVGILQEETDKTVVVVSEIEKYADRNDCTFTVILKTAIISQKSFGEIEIEF